MGAIEVGESPVQITSVAEDAQPKVVQFEETLIIRVRHSPLEFPIRISVRELHTFGNKELCECYISPLLVANWPNAHQDGAPGPWHELELCPMDLGRTPGAA